MYVVPSSPPLRPGLVRLSLPGNQSPRARRVFSARWVGDDAVFARRAGRTSPPFPDLRLEDGEPLDAPIFPVVYRS